MSLSSQTPTCLMGCESMNALCNEAKNSQPISEQVAYVSLGTQINYENPTLLKTCVAVLASTLMAWTTSMSYRHD